MIASGSIPVIFPNLHYKGMNLMDGCTIWDINVDQAINECLNMGYDQRDIIVDQLICKSHNYATESKSGNTIDNLIQSSRIGQAYSNMDAVQA